MTLQFDDFSFNTVVGNSSFIKGDLHVSGSIRIDGNIDGNIETDGNINIGENAKIRGNITTISATVAGIILGNIYAKENIRLLSGSIIIGDVLARHVIIEDNVIFHGKCISISNKENFDSISENYLQAKTIEKKVGRL